MSSNEKLVITGNLTNRRSFLRNSAGLAGVALSGTALLQALAACGDSTATPGSAGATTAAKIQQAATLQLNWIKNCEFAGIFLAVDKGYYKDEGIDLSLLPGGGQIDSTTVVVSGSAQIGIVSAATTLLASRSKGTPLVAIGSTFQKSPGALVTKASSGINSPQDFIGKKIGIQNTARISIETILKLQKIPMDKVTLVTVTSDPTPLITGQIDLLTSFSTNQPLTLKDKGIEPKVFLYYDLGFKQEADVIFTTEDTLAKRPELLEGFMRATMKGWEYTARNPDEVAELVVNKYGEGLSLGQQKAQTKAGLELMYSDLSKEKGMFWMNKEVWDMTNQTAIDSGIITAKLDLNKAMNFSVLEKLHGKKA
jgi:ABC-type nitrate/sulfonate/bicarbonate transport system substrate-binding protein